jgi:phosphoglucosamine mutase
VKVFGRDGRKWPDEKEEALEKKLLSLPPRFPGEGPGAGAALPTAPDPALAETYLERLLSRLPRSLREISVLLDAANGAAYLVGPEALRRAGCRVTPMADRPDGRNINAQCGAMHPDGMARATSNVGADVGVALDGDADRAIFADETGRLLDGDDVLWIVARRWKQDGRLGRGGVVGTVMSNFGLEKALAREGIPFHRAAVGDRSVAMLMEETGSELGGETSGHILFAPLSPAGDGIQTALVVASILSDAGQPLSRLATLEKSPQALRNVRVLPLPRRRFREGASRRPGSRVPALLGNRASVPHPRRRKRRERSPGDRRLAGGGRARVVPLSGFVIPRAAPTFRARGSAPRSRWVPEK